jgi:hypothetical protein
MKFDSGNDEELKRQQQQAEADKIDAIRERVSSQTSQSMRLFGSRWALSGASGVPLLSGS